MSTSMQTNWIATRAKLNKSWTKKAQISNHLSDREIEQLSSSSEELSSPKSKFEMQGIEHNATKHLKHPFWEQRSWRTCTFQLIKTLDLCGERLYPVTRPTHAHENEAPTYHVKIGNDPTSHFQHSTQNTQCGWRFCSKFQRTATAPPEGYTPIEVQQILQRGTALLQPTQQIIHTLVHPPAKQTPTRVSAHAQIIDCDLTFQQNTSGRKVCIPWVRHSRWGCTVTYITALYRKVVEYSEKFVPSLGRGHSSSSEKQ